MYYVTVTAWAAKQSIAAFKLREGDIIGYQVTLRGVRKIDFLNKLVHVTLVTSANTKAEAEALLRHVGMPLQKAE